MIAAAIFAVLFHSNLNRSVWADFGWAFSQYLETIAILSQFILFNKKVKVSVILGRINIDLHISFHRGPSDLKIVVINFLDFHLYIIKRVQQKQGIKPSARVCGLLVHDNPNNPSVYNGRFHVLLDQGLEKRRRSPTTYFYLI